MKKEKIIELLKDYEKADVEKFASYIIGLYLAKDIKTQQIKNIWIQKRSEEEMAKLYERVNSQGLVFDGVHITLQKTGITYDYIAYKNKMLVAYPETIIDVELVYIDDDFSFSKDSGVVQYSHKIGDPFKRVDAGLVGGYCVIKNKRGEFMTILKLDDFNKHRKVAKTDFIWKSWFVEMCKKTLIKKACKLHFDDIFTSIDSEDNKSYNLENPLNLDLEIKQAIDNVKTIAELTKLYNHHKSKVDNISEFNKYITIKRKELNENS